MAFSARSEWECVFRSVSQADGQRVSAETAVADSDSERRILRALLLLRSGAILELLYATRGVDSLGLAGVERVRGA